MPAYRLESSPAATRPSDKIAEKFGLDDFLLVEPDATPSGVLREQLTMEIAPPPAPRKGSVWKRDVEVEESAYYHRGAPVVWKRRAALSGPATVEFFCGCGGLSTGFELAGFQTALAADIHKPSANTFVRNHPTAHVLLGDLRRVEEAAIKTLADSVPAVVLAGIPCQGFSLNNRKRHSEDKRNFLFLDLLRFLAVLRPPMVVIENVSGLVSTKGGAFVDAIKEGLHSVGYPRVDHRLLNAADYGVPQSRQRVFFVASRVDAPFVWPEPTHGPATGIPHLTIRDAIFDLPPIQSGERADEYIQKPITNYQSELRGDQVDLLNHIAPKHPAATIRKIARTKPGAPMYPRFAQRIRLSWEMPSPTQVSGGIRPQFQFGHPELARGLTIRERCRIQSFPDRYEILGGTVQGRVQTGNAVPPRLARAIAQACAAHMTRHKLWP